MRELNLSNVDTSKNIYLNRIINAIKHELMNLCKILLNFIALVDNSIRNHNCWIELDVWFL